MSSEANSTAFRPSQQPAASTLLKKKFNPEGGLPLSDASAASYDPSFYTWKTFFRAMFHLAGDNEMKQYIQADSILNEERKCRQCEQNLDWVLKYSPTITFMRENIQKFGGDVNSKNVICRRCNTLDPRGIKKAMASPTQGILLCANHVTSKRDIEDVLTHEMVHAYDYLRFKFDNMNLKHVACSEIRANALSSECRWSQEFLGGNFKLTQHFQDCVRRRAILAVKRNNQCADDLQATKVVNEVWQSCFRDTRPFDEIYR